MENAVEALKTAAAVLIFVVAITIAFVMFSRAKVTADAVTKSQDEQAYLDSPDVSEGILYVSSEDISGDKIASMTQEGYRIVGFNDVVSTIYRYSLEKYGVTIINSTGKVEARFDSNTEGLIQQWNDTSRATDEIKNKTTEQIEKNLSNHYIRNPQLNLWDIYSVKNEDGVREYGAPWLGDKFDIVKRVNADIRGTSFEKNRKTYTGKGLENILKNKKIIEVVNEIDTSEYIENTSLLKSGGFQLPTIEVIYIIQN